MLKLERPDFKEINAVVATNKGVDKIGQTVFAERDGYLEIAEGDVSELTRFHPDGDALALELVEV